MRGPDAGAEGSGSPEPAAIAETHCAVVVFLGDRAYKVKKPVDLGFVDFRSVGRDGRRATGRSGSTAGSRPTSTWASLTSSARTARSATTWS